ncbi:MAG TPA: peptide chain release factor N(5)-glutamine methyltransferase [Agriterribacter sp.]|nr:peptide chain release factor N(5)-glutamine methyltransferase [Chitinophagaceae bacterium]HRP32527.1 peptide chain release factor N(5)-glutamine methyltransferase [Agriterribacter sp.]
MTLNEAQHSLAESLATIYDRREASNIANLVMEKVTGMGRQHRLKYREYVVLPTQQAALIHIVNQLIQHRPVQYVLEEAWFYGMPLFVNENVLIPRPETEELVAWILKDVQHDRTTGEACSAMAGNPVILDIGTGSGCIAISLKKNIPDSNVFAIDVSEKALNVARKNALDQQCPIQFLNTDFLNPEQSATLGRFNIIVSNPPYIPKKDKAEMQKNVLEHEPHTALFVENNNPLLFYSAIAAFAEQHLLSNGCIYLEIHESMAEAIRQLFTGSIFSSVEVRQDMQGKDRMAKVRKIS